MDYLYKGKTYPEINQITNYNKIFKKLKNDIISIIDNEVEKNEKNIRDRGWSHDKINCCVKTDTRTEKRLCRCLYSNNREDPKCNYCALEECALFNSEKEEIKKYFCKKIINAKIVDYEIPVSNNSKDGIGEIDLLIKYEGDYYCTEVKPCWNNETILRMILEILTYTKMMEKNISYYKDNKYTDAKDLKKAILFMEGSKQETLWNEQNKSIKYAVSVEMKDFLKENDITVFCLKQDNNQYYLEKIQ